MLLSIVRFLIKCFMYLVFRLRVHGRENFPKEGAVIVALNHRSYWDVPLVGSVLPRQLTFMAKKELFDVPVLGAIIKWADAFPVALIAEKAGAPILPVAISGRYRFLSKVDVYIGEPIYVKPPEGGKLNAEELQAVSDRLLKTILDMAEGKQKEAKHS